MCSIEKIMEKNSEKKLKKKKNMLSHKIFIICLCFCHPMPAFIAMLSINIDIDLCCHIWTASTPIDHPI
jgi:hypothetical protein